MLANKNKAAFIIKAENKITPLNPKFLKIR